MVRWTSLPSNQAENRLKKGKDYFEWLYYISNTDKALTKLEFSDEGTLQTVLG